MIRRARAALTRAIKEEDWFWLSMVPGVWHARIRYWNGGDAPRGNMKWKNRSWWPVLFDLITWPLDWIWIPTFTRYPDDEDPWTPGWVLDCGRVGLVRAADRRLVRLRRVDGTYVGQHTLYDVLFAATNRFTK